MKLFFLFLLIFNFTSCRSDISDIDSKVKERAANENPEYLDEIILKLYKQIDEEHLQLKKLEKAELLAWFNDALPLVFLKEDRRNIQAYLKTDQLAQNYSIEISKIGIPGISDRIVLNPNNEIIVNGSELFIFSTFAQSACVEDRVCKEEFFSEFPDQTNILFPTSVPVEITPIKVQGECLAGEPCERDSLLIQFAVSEKNKADLAKYFSVGFSYPRLISRLDSLLGNEKEKWIKIEDILYGWISNKANTFPKGGDNEVCHGPARQFFNEKLFNGQYDRSTEATSSLLKRYYCLLDDNDLPAFGDYLYVPGVHSGRFIMVDPKSNRWISFSVYSGGGVPYRFWWTDEDFSGNPFAHEPLADFQDKLDDWRRCR